MPCSLIGTADRILLEIDEGTVMGFSDGSFDGSNEGTVMGTSVYALERSRYGILDGSALGVSFGYNIVKHLDLTKASYLSLKMVVCLALQLEQEMESQLVLMEEMSWVLHMIILWFY